MVVCGWYIGVKIYEILFDLLDCFTLYLHSEEMTLDIFINCESSSAGRARPCQGRGRGFESRLSLHYRITEF